RSGRTSRPGCPVVSAMPRQGFGNCRLWLLLLVTLARWRGLVAVEFRGTSVNPAQYKPVLMSSTAQIEITETDGDKAVDGDYRQHLFYSKGCAVTKRQ
ncbi:unnamed protein product, partial [Polarella glacialis]